MLACADPPTAPTPSAASEAPGGLRAERARLIRVLRDVDAIGAETPGLRDRLAGPRAELVELLRGVEQRIRAERERADS